MRITNPACKYCTNLLKNYADFYVKNSGYALSSGSGRFFRIGIWIRPGQNVPGSPQLLTKHCQILIWGVDRQIIVNLWKKELDDATDFSSLTVTSREVAVLVIDFRKCSFFSFGTTTTVLTFVEIHFLVYLKLFNYCRTKLYGYFMIRIWIAKAGFYL